MPPLTVCAPLPLKLTVLGVVLVTLSVPAVTVYAPAIPSVALVESWKELPFKVTLKRLAVPLSEEAPVKVAVPAVAVKLPLTSMANAMEKLTAVVTVPATSKS